MSEQGRTRRSPIMWHALRDIILFFAGLGGVAHETLIATTERPTLLLLYAAMMGLPMFLRADERRRNGGSS